MGGKCAKKSCCLWKDIGSRTIQYVKIDENIYKVGVSIRKDYLLNIRIFFKILEINNESLWQISYENFQKENVLKNNIVFGVT